jgi:hypothetical protein
LLAGVKTILVTTPDQSVTPSGSIVVKFGWAPSSDASAVFGVSPDGGIIGIAETPDRGPGVLRLYDRSGMALLSRPLYLTQVHGPPLLGLLDLAVTSQTSVCLLYQAQDSFSVDLLTPNPTGMSTKGMYLTQGVADQLAVSGADIWAHDAASDLSYPVFLSGQAIWQNQEQQAKAMEGLLVGGTWVKTHAEGGNVVLTAAGLGADRQTRFLAPSGYQIASTRLLGQDVRGRFYLLLRLRATEAGGQLSMSVVVSFGVEGVKHGQLSLQDDGSAPLSRFTVAQDGTVYRLQSTPQELDVLTYSANDWEQ